MVSTAGQERMNEWNTQTRDQVNSHQGLPHGRCLWFQEKVQGETQEWRQQCGVRGVSRAPPGRRRRDDVPGLPRSEGTSSGAFF